MSEEQRTRLEPSERTRLEPSEPTSFNEEPEVEGHVFAAEELGDEEDRTRARKGRKMSDPMEPGRAGRKLGA